MAITAVDSETAAMIPMEYTIIRRCSVTRHRAFRHWNMVSQNRLLNAFSLLDHLISFRGRPSSKGAASRFGSGNQSEWNFPDIVG
jgi:hypothetical protein